jgi:hypothetical protein
MYAPATLPAIICSGEPPVETCSCSEPTLDTVIGSFTPDVGSDTPDAISSCSGSTVCSICSVRFTGWPAVTSTFCWRTSPKPRYVTKTA